MDYQFDRVTDRYNTNCLKYDFKKEWGVPDDVLPLWVADMDLQVAPAVTRRLEKIVAHGIYGYSGVKEDYYEAVTGWFDRRFGYRPDPSWTVLTPGVVFALSNAVRAFTRPGESILIQRPVYYPFSMVIENNGRKLVNNPLVEKDGHYTIDLTDFEQKIVDHDVKMFILCSPHNPVGRVWTEDELRQMEEICLRHDVILVSDEIHCDFVWQGREHHMLFSLDEAYKKNTVVCTAPSKSFNLAGLQCSNIFIPDPGLRERFRRELQIVGYNELNVMGTAACQAAYEAGEEWLDAACAYIRDNLCYMESFLRENVPQISMRAPEGTYLAWLDLRALRLDREAQKDLILNRAKLWLDTGTMFGPEGAGFERVNAACPRAILSQAMEQLADAVGSLA